MQGCVALSGDCSNHPEGRRRRDTGYKEQSPWARATGRRLACREGAEQGIPLHTAPLPVVALSHTLLSHLLMLFLSAPWPRLMAAAL